MQQQMGAPANEVMGSRAEQILLELTSSHLLFLVCLYKLPPHAGIKKNAFTMFSAHQMGTARMGADPKKSCVDPEGQCWEVSALQMPLMLGAMVSIWPDAHMQICRCLTPLKQND